MCVTRDMSDRNTDRCAVCGQSMGNTGDYRHVRDLKRKDSDEVITMRWAPLCKTHLVEFDKRRQSH